MKDSSKLLEGKKEYPDLDWSDPVVKMIWRVPLTFDWCEYKGETLFAGINYEASQKAKKPMMDLFYCATEACNHNVMRTVQWDKNKFKPSHLGAKF